MTLAVLCIIIAGLGFALCAVLAEPWQRPRYEQWADQASAKKDELEAVIASEMRREAQDG